MKYTQLLRWAGWAGAGLGGVTAASQLLDTDRGQERWRSPPASSSWSLLAKSRPGPALVNDITDPNNSVIKWDSNWDKRFGHHMETSQQFHTSEFIY